MRPSDPHTGIGPQKVSENSAGKGVKGMLPLGCLPLWGREGVTLIVAIENKQAKGRKQYKKNRIC